MVRKVSAIIGSAIFLVIAPGSVAALAPWWISRWRLNPPLFGLSFIRFAGGALIALGAIGLLDSFARFAVQGVGTPAPVFPTRHLVVTGLYRYVRNPMYLAVVSMIFGQALLLGNVTLLQYGTLVWALCHVFVVVYEEPKLRASFGYEYKSYCNDVARWIPGFTAWSGPKREDTEGG
jgi:protein-S-isoprenylcysteine O-methyltransferase Ste14